MDLKLKGKTASVTGSTAGIGLAIAESLAKEGASVVVNGRTQSRVDEAIKHLSSLNGKLEISGLAADLSSREGVKIVEKQMPQVDILVNNLGTYEVKAFQEITDDDWSRIFDVNVFSGVRLSRLYLPRMLANNWGRIVFISSESGLNIPSEMIHYGVTKTAQLALARGLAETTAGTNVTVNSVLAGPTRSEGVEQFVASLAKSKGISQDAVEKEFFTTVRPSSLLKRFASTAEVANLVTYVCSPLASATNGAALRAEGGVVRSVI